MATSLSISGLPSNTRFPGPIRAHNPNGISIGLAVFAEMIAIGRPLPPQKCPFSWREGSGPHLIHGSWANPSPQPKRHLDRFSRFCTDHRRKSLFFTMVRSFPPLIAPSHKGDLDPYLIYGSWAHLSPQPKRHLDRIGSAVFAGLTTVIDIDFDRSTDRQTTLLRLYQ